MIKKLIVVFVAIFAFQIQAQEGTASPYSFYGIGTLKFKGTVENRSMGGLSIYSDSIHINLRNPAFYASDKLKMFKDDGQLVKFSVGGGYSSLNLKANSGSEKASTTTFDYLALAIPVGKFGFGFGLLPYTSVGYKLESLDNEGNTENRYRGEGGLNKAFLGFGYMLSRGLRIGADVSYNFGKVENSAIAFVYNDEGELVQFQTRENNRSDLSGLNFNLGISYNTKLNKKLDLVASATYSPESNLTSNNTRSFSTIVINSFSGQEFVVETVEADLAAQNLDKTDLTLPSRLSFGAGIGESKKWFVGVEYTLQNTSKFANPIFNIENSTFENSSALALGGFYIPNYDVFSGYLKKIVYRAGLRYETTGLKINNESIDEFGISFGVGLPVGVGTYLSNLNLGFEYGKRGTTNQNLIQENFFNVNISLSLNDRWFRKRKFN